MSKVYSYVRFSSKSQGAGTSQQRQSKSAQEYCRERGWHLETGTYENLGVSAWKGRNVDSGQLGAFFKAVDAGLIAKDGSLLSSTLIV